MQFKAFRAECPMKRLAICHELRSAAFCETVRLDDTMLQNSGKTGQKTSIWGGLPIVTDCSMCDHGVIVL